MRPSSTSFPSCRQRGKPSRGRSGVAQALLAAFAIAGATWLYAGVPVAHAQADTGFQRYVDRLWPRARKRGISRATFDAAFKGVVPDPEVWEKDAHQPEFVMPASHYISLAVSDTRIEEGSKKLEIHAELLDKIEKRYGVDRHVLVAIWGMETNYGTYLGKKYVIQALATLGYKGRRTKFGRRQLMAALKILEQGHTTPERMEGSWAGAMGHTQFIPTTYTGNAVDFDGDGRRDIWDTLPDALASTANYLKKSGWQYGKTWGYEVVLPKRFNTRLAGLRRRSSLAHWRKLGVKRVGGEPFPRPSDRASLYLPAGRKGPAFLVLKNFRVIMRYNAATKYALGVGYLSDRIRGYPAFSTPWPDGVRPLDSDERRELQELLIAKGFAIGEIDGVIGSKTREALRTYQKKKGMKADGFPSPKLLESLRKDG
jgi:membrane-bound lytic murein transglycosylase B